MIGVFDSGYGGLTVLQALVERLPDRDFLYLGDHANAPYGGRSEEEIYDLTKTSIERLFARGCRLAILACNTASAVALRRLQQGWLAETHPDRRVLGVLVPAVEAITRQPWQLEEPLLRDHGEPRLVAVFATRRTVESGAYEREIGRRAPRVRVVQQACPQLAAGIEAGWPPAQLAEMIEGDVAQLLDRLAGEIPDEVVLGCTHYPLVKEAFAKALPAGALLLDQPSLTARSLAAYLLRHPNIDGAAPRNRRLQWLTTGEPAEVSDRAKRFFGGAAEFMAWQDWSTT